jgi:hypothetical protein
MVSVDEVVNLHGLQMCNYSSSKSVNRFSEDIIMTFNIVSGSLDVYDIQHDAQHGRRGMFVPNISFCVEPISFRTGATDLEVHFLGIDASYFLKVHFG